jgi:signal-transduction protein with cAMP-binding, CBS, and nucleotidyltransferase domain
MTVQLDPARIAQAVQGLHVFERLPKQAGVALIEGGQLLEFEVGEFLIKQGHPSDFALVLVDGVVVGKTRLLMGLVVPVVVPFVVCCGAVTP